MLVLLAVY